MSQQQQRTWIVSAGIALLSMVVSGAAAPAVQDFPLRETTGLIEQNVRAEAVEYLGRRAVKLTRSEQQQGQGLAFLPGVEFQDGVIEVDVAAKVITPPGVRMPGFIGIAFRSRPDGSKYELFYIRPRNARAADQAMRNHAVQYCSEPGFGWYPLRRAWPWVYEAHAHIDEQAWTHLKIEVAGRTAKLSLNNAPEPTLIVDGLKGEDLKGSVGLWPSQGQESYFSNLRVTHATPQPVKNGSDAAGAWEVSMNTDYGPYKGDLTLTRSGNALSGTWTGSFGQSLPVKGTWREGYVELTFAGAWPQGGGDAAVTLAGWFDGDAAKGRGKVEDRADGVWTATAKKQTP
jgi:hypothetical protein